MDEEDTELNNYNRYSSGSNNHCSTIDGRYSISSENSFNQKTLYGPNPFINGDSSKPQEYLSKDDAAVGMKSGPIRRHSFGRISPNRNTVDLLNHVESKTSSTLTPTSATSSKPNLFKRFMASLPIFPHMRKSFKASVALVIALIFVFDSQTRDVIGESSVLLVPIVVIFYFPVRTIGIQTEAVVIGTMGGLLAAAWSFLGTFLASLARDQSDPNPVQPSSCAVLAVFLFFGTFVLNLLRMQAPKSNFGAVIACIVLCFTMTYSAGYSPFVPEVTWLFLRPIAVAGAVSLAVNYFLWPDDSINNFLGMARMTLGGYNAFFKEHSDAFLATSSSSNGSSSLPTLNTRLKNGVLLLMDCKRAVKREVLYSRISDKDCGALTNAIITMRTSLHGIGLSLILKNNYLTEEGTKNLYFQSFSNPRTIDAFTTTLENIRPLASELAELCDKATTEGSARLGDLHYHPRTTLNSILWPFPRLWVSKPKASEALPQEVAERLTSRQLQEAIDRFDKMTKSDETFRKFLDLNSADIPRNGPLYLTFLYIHNLKQHADDVHNFVELIETLETKRTRYKLWFPHQTLKKWLISNNSEVGDYTNTSEGRGTDLIRVSTRPDSRRDTSNDDDNIFGEMPTSGTKKTDRQNHPCSCDPDVSAPVTAYQKFFNWIYLFGKWLTDTNTFFALKTSIGVVILAIPAWRPEDAAWYIAWRGQWAMIILVLWMFPMTGTFIFGLIDRVGGSIVGCVLGILIWVMTRGNTYGLSAVSFICFLPMYHVFFFVPKYRVAALMVTITICLVISYEYGYIWSGETSYDAVWTVAGKRLFLIVIGISASGILMAIPFPPTSRVELRKRVSLTVRDIGRAYGILSASALSPEGVEAHPQVIKAFQKLSIELRRQVAEEQTLLHYASYEPPLRGYFPATEYTLLVEKMDSMSDLVINMGSALRRVRREWRRNIASILMKERKEYLSSTLTSLKLISSTLSAKTALPPYMLSPVESRQRWVNLLEKKMLLRSRDITDPSFPSYSTYLMNSLVFVDELQALLTAVEELVGVEDPEEWLYARA